MELKQTFFLAKLFLIFLESFETHFDLVTSKIGSKLDDLIIYGVLVNFLRILSTKSTISQKLKIENIRKLFFILAYEYYASFGTKKN